MKKTTLFAAALLALQPLCAPAQTKTAVKSASDGELTTALKGKDAQTREAAAVELGMRGSLNSLPALLDALKDKSADVRREAAQSLGRLGDEQAVDPLSDALANDTDSQVRAEAAAALGEIGSLKAVTALVKAAGTEQNMTARALCIASLGHIEANKETENALLFSLSDPENIIRLSAAKALANTSTIRTAAGLGAALLDDPDPQIRSVAARSLGHCCAPERARSFYSDDIWGDPSVLLNLTGRPAKLEANTGKALLYAMTKDTVAKVRGEAALALGRTTDNRYTPFLIKTLAEDTDPYVRAMAANSLGSIGDKSALNALTTAMQDPDGNVRMAAGLAANRLPK